MIFQNVGIGWRHHYSICNIVIIYVMFPNYIVIVINVCTCYSSDVCQLYCIFGINMSC